MAKNHFGRHVWLMDNTQKHGRIAFSDISSDLRERSALNDDGGHLYKEA